MHKGDLACEYNLGMVGRVEVRLWPTGLSQQEATDGRFLATFSIDVYRLQKHQECTNNLRETRDLAGHPLHCTTKLLEVITRRRFFHVADAVSAMRVETDAILRHDSATPADLGNEEDAFQPMTFEVSFGTAGEETSDYRQELVNSRHTGNNIVEP